MNVEVVQKKLWEQSQQHRDHRLSDTPLFPVNHFDGRVRNLMDLMHTLAAAISACRLFLSHHFELLPAVPLLL